ncbi:MAG: hypothetical protein ACM3ZQ_05330 [Bacillota bacterium]
MNAPALVAHVVGKNLELYPDMLLIRAADPLGIPMPPEEDRQPLCIPLRLIASTITSYHGFLGSQGQLFVRLINGETFCFDFCAHEIELVEQLKLLLEDSVPLA